MEEAQVSEFLSSLSDGMGMADSGMTPEIAKGIAELRDDKGEGIIQGDANRSLNLLYELCGVIQSLGAEATLQFLSELPPDQLRNGEWVWKSPTLADPRSRFELEMELLRGKKSGKKGKSGFICKNPKCRSDNTTATPIQLRSADEPMSSLVECNVCGKRWREG